MNKTHYISHQERAINPFHTVMLNYLSENKLMK